MKFKDMIFPILFSAACGLTACNNSSDKSASSAVEPTQVGDTAQPTAAAPVAMKAETVEYKAGKLKMLGYLAYDSAKGDRRPVVLVVPEWWGLNDYTRSRARQLADLGYLAMVVDMYGEGKTADNPEKAGKMAGPFYADPALAKSRFDAAMSYARTLPAADTTNIAAIGYCFGGAQVINMAKLGEPLKGVVSFHGSLLGVPAKKELLKTPMLICHGEADQFVKPEEVEAFKKQLDSIDADYTFRSYKDAGHAFTNPEATAMGKKHKIPVAYNEAADKASWNEMKDFFKRIFK